MNSLMIVRRPLCQTVRQNTIQQTPTRLASQESNIVQQVKKPRKVYKEMRKVNPSDDILSPAQWKYMRVRVSNLITSEQESISASDHDSTY